MTPGEVERHIERIMWGKSYIDLSSYGSFILRSLTIKEANYVSYLYNREYNKAVQEGILKLKDMKELFRAMEIWGNPEEEKLAELDKKITREKNNIKSFQFMNRRKKQAQKELDRLQKERKELAEMKDSLFTCTAEQRAEEVKRRHIVRLSTETIEEKPYWNTEEDFWNETDIQFIFKLAVAYYNYNMLAEKDLRLIARHPMWRYRWNASKNGADLFGRPISEWSEMQNTLVYWSQFYDYIYESMDRPGDYIIEDDAACDAWVEEQNKKARKPIVKEGGKKMPHQEHFIMVDPGDTDTIKQIHEMNPESVRQRLRNEHKTIKEKKWVSEWKLRKGK